MKQIGDSMVHAYHPNTHKYGLQDDCERCAQHALYPFEGLDDENLVNLYHRLEDDSDSGRSRNEQRAMDTLAENIRQGRVLAEALTRIEARKKVADS